MLLEQESYEEYAFMSVHSEEQYSIEKGCCLVGSLFVVAPMCVCLSQQDECLTRTCLKQPLSKRPNNGFQDKW